MSDEPVVDLGKREARNGAIKKVAVNVAGVPCEVTIRIPAGVKDGALLRLPGVEQDDEILVRARVRSKARWYVAGILAPIVVLGAVLVIAMSGSSVDGPTPAASSPVVTSEPSLGESTTAVVPGTATTTVLSDPLDGLPVGECLRNAGTNASPTMVPQSCARDTFRVLASKIGTVDKNVCSVVDGNTHAYVVSKYVLTTRNGVEVSRNLSVQDSYVLCLHQL